MSVYAGPEITTDGLVLSLDAANSRSYPGSGNTWIDLSGNGNQATLMNGTSLSSTNRGTMLFDGIDDYATLPSSSAWAVGQNATFENWLYFDKDSASTNHRIWCVTNNSTSIDIFISVSSGILSTSGSSGFPGTVDALPKKQWVHLVVRFMSGNLSIFFNGESKTLTGTTTGINKTNTGTLFLGQFSGGGNYYFQGRIATYTLYNRALSDAEIQQNFNALRGRFGL